MASTRGCGYVLVTRSRERELVVDLLRGSRQLVTDLLRENWCNGFWPLVANDLFMIVIMVVHCVFRRACKYIVQCDLLRVATL